MAELADSIMEILRLSRNQDMIEINTVSKQTNSDSTLILMKELQDLVCRLSEQVKELQLRENKHSRNYGRSRSKQRSQSRNKEFDEKSSECWYHQIWIDQAHKRISPCTYSKN